MRHKLLGEPTARQSQTALSAATADMDNDQTDDQIVTDQTTTTTTTTVTTNNQNPRNYGDKFFVHYTHEQRFNTLKRDMHQVYEHTFQNTPAMYTKMVVGTRNRRDTKNELIRKRPKRTLLQNTITKRECHSKISSFKFDTIIDKTSFSLFFSSIGQQKKITKRLNKHTTTEHK